MDNKSYIDKNKSGSNSNKPAPTSYTIEYEFQGRRFIIKRGADTLGACYANAKRFLWEMNGKEVTAQEWIGRYKQWDPDCGSIGGCMVLASMYNMAYGNHNILGELAVARVASELNVLDLMCNLPPGMTQLRLPIPVGIGEVNLLRMDPVEAFERFNLPEESVSDDAASSTE